MVAAPDDGNGETCTRMARRETRHERRPRVHQLQCVQCGCASGLYAIGWRGYLAVDPELGEAPELAFFCPTCAEQEFDAPRRDRRD
jgi:hypothetical protein